MSELAVATASVNLGQGFPDTDGPAEIAQAAADAIMAGRGNQYPPGAGVPPLREAIADHQRRFYGLEIDPDREVLVTAGATEAIAAALLALVEPGDEVIAFEPYYDSYAACIAMAGRRPGAGDADRAGLPARPRRAAGGRHRPHPADLAELAAQPDWLGVYPRRAGRDRELACARDLLVICDEVYEHMVFDRRARAGLHAARHGERTVTISSGAKTFSFTGWKIGWVTGTPQLVAAVRTVKQFLTFVNGGPFQYAIAQALALADEYYRSIAADLLAKRDLMCDGLASTRLRGLSTGRHVLHHHCIRSFGAPCGDSQRAGVLPQARRRRRAWWRSRA